MELLPTVDALHWVAKAGPKVLADEKVRMTQAFTLSKSGHFSYEPIGVGRGDRALELPLVDPLRRGGDRADGGQRRGAEAGLADAAAGREDPLGVRARRRAGGAGAGRPRRRRRSARRSAAPRSARSSSPARSRSAATSARSARRELKGSVLELGGKDPMIVCADADLGNAVSGAIWGGFANAGQTCSGIERVYVMREVADRFVAGVAREAQRLRLGDPLDWETAIGPMTSDSQYETVVELIDDAVAAGATKLCGGPIEVPGLAGQVHRADRPHRRHPRDADHARGDLRAGAADRRRRLRAGGDRPRQRLRVRARRLGLDARPGARRTDRAGDRVGHGLDQRPLLQPRRLPVLLGRGEELRARPLALQIRLLRVRRTSR